ncbi:hypothetical protein ASF00_04250 [Sphingomonas sp. Leaf34]|nr:hypothetical protein ASF00_04250 [Sphingomonas sp. Leaf34]
MPSLVFCANANGEAIFYNSRFREFTGLTDASLLGSAWLFAIHQDDREPAELAWRQAIATGEPYETEYRLRGADGKYYWLLIRCVPVRADRRVDHWIGIGVDIDDRNRRAFTAEAYLERTQDALAGSEARYRETQDALTASYAELEQRVIERTHELRQANALLLQEMNRREALQATLLQSQKLEALGQLTSSVAHNFNNVLAVITGGFALIQKRAEDPQILKLAGDGAVAAERGAHLMQKLMSFARLQNVVARTIDLAPVFVDLAPELRRLAGPQIAIVIGDAHRMPAVRIDPGQLETALANLLVNARDAMREGGPLRIDFEEIGGRDPRKPRELGEMACVAIHVVDAGSGMPAPVLQRALEPFFTTKAPDKGAGLGLAMVHGLMMQSGGALRLASVVGRGTTVSLYLPVAASAVTQEPDAAAVELRSHGGGRVLLVEDDDLVRSIVADQLVDLGYSVVPAVSATDAMAKVHDGEPLAFIVIDYCVAGSGAVKFIASARGVRPNLPILFISGQFNLTGVAHEAVLLKPFLPEQLSKAVLDMVERSQRLDARDASLDSMAARFKSAVLNRVLTQWRGERSGETLPALNRVPITRDERDFVAEVVVDQTYVPMTFELVQVGAELSRRAETDFTWWRIDGTGDDSEMTQEGAYRRCVRSRKPTYDFARFDFGSDDTSFFERLLLPCSEDGAEVTSLIAVVNFDETDPAEGQ